MKHQTKIVATVGPASDSYEELNKLVDAGVNVFRLNFSHGTHEQHAEVIQKIRRINEEKNLHIAILADLQGPKLRVGELQGESLALSEGDIIAFTNEKEEIGTKDNIFISYPNLHLDCKVGELILLDDGKIETEIIEITSDNFIKAKVKTGGVLLPRKGVNLPYTNISLPSLTEKDLKDLDFIIEHELDWVGLSFVRKPKDIFDLRFLLTSKDAMTKIIAKIEKPEAVENLREIILASDGVMVARGDLGVELPVEKVPMIQKDIVRKCIHRAKPVIIATQMMESMMEKRRPNRSEMSDVANAVMEGADAVMLSGETAMGKHPALVVKTMVDIIQEVEKEKTVYNRNLIPQPHSPSFLSDALCYNACRIAEDINADAIIGMTQSGYTGFMLSSFRPYSELFVFTQTKQLVNQLSLSWGVKAFYYEENTDLDKMIETQISILKEKGLLHKGDVVVNTGSLPVTERLPTNMVKITKVK
ncbi:MAG TPA: pyruvate kinase [Chitinophagaceae bacterium]|nr:pyruvate kinase [Chitinophagaceae bacterium]